MKLEVDEGNNRRWLITFTGPKDSLYENEELTLQFTFPPMYPIKPPDVKFVSNVPIHPHVYSTGEICLSILVDDWTPELTVESVSMSIISMLSSCSDKKRPPDDRLVSNTLFRRFVKKLSFYFDDDQV